MLRLWLLPKYQTHTYWIISFNIKKVKVKANKGKSNDDLENVTFKGLFTAKSSQISNLLFNFYSPNSLWCIFKSNAIRIYWTWKLRTFFKIFLRGYAPCVHWLVLCVLHHLFLNDVLLIIFDQKIIINIKTENRLSVNNYLIPSKMFTNMILSVTH